MLSDELKTKVVGIAGCGGLGSNCAAALVRAGVGTLVLADFDVVTASNLNRQFYFMDQTGQKKVTALRENLLRINPETTLVLHDRKLKKSDIVPVFSLCDVIVEAFDEAAAKEMIIETVLESMPGKYIVSGVGLAGWGDNNSIHTLESGKLIICGDGLNEVSDQLPPLAPRVGIVAHMQANAVLEILLGPCALLRNTKEPGISRC